MTRSYDEPEPGVLLRHVEYAIDQARGATGDELGVFIGELHKLIGGDYPQWELRMIEQSPVRPPSAAQQLQDRIVKQAVVEYVAQRGGFAPDDAGIRRYVDTRYSHMTPEFRDYKMGLLKDSIAAARGWLAQQGT